jgi:hypothetical protein
MGIFTFRVLRTVPLLTCHFHDSTPQLTPWRLKVRFPIADAIVTIWKSIGWASIATRLPNWPEVTKTDWQIALLLVLRDYRLEQQQVDATSPQC